MSLIHKCDGLKTKLGATLFSGRGLRSGGQELVDSAGYCQLWEATAVLALWDAALRTWQWKEEILFTLSISPGLLYSSRGLGGLQDRGLRLIANQESILLGNQILNCAPSLCSDSHKLQQYRPHACFLMYLSNWRVRPVKTGMACHWFLHSQQRSWHMADASLEARSPSPWALLR